MTNKLEELDRLRLLLAVEKAAHLETKLREMQMAFNITQAELKQVKQKQEATSAEIKAKYNLAPGDTLDPETGNITRVEDPHDQAARPAPVVTN
jgi:hypothetical protein